MEDAGLVRDLDAAANARHQRRHPRWIQAAFAPQQAAQIFAGDEFHHQKGRAVGEVAVVVDRHDRRMLQPRDDLRFAVEARARIRIGDQIRAHHLDRHRPLEPHVPRAEHRAHAALADDRVHAILAVDERADADRGAAAAAHDDGGGKRGRRARRRAAGQRRGAGPFSEPRQVHRDAHLHRDAAQQLAVFRRVRLFRSLLAERDQSDERSRIAAAREDRHEERRVERGEPRAIGRRHPGHRRLFVVQEDLERLVGPLQQRDDAALGRQRRGVDSERCHLLEPARGFRVMPRIRREDGE